MESSALLQAVGERVRTLRLARGHSQETFAALANLDRGAFGKIERGEINTGVLTLARIAGALDVSLAELLDGVTFDPARILALPRLSRGPRPIRLRSGREP